MDDLSCFNVQVLESLCNLLDLFRVFRSTQDKQGVYHYQFEFFAFWLIFEILCSSAVFVPLHHNSGPPLELKRHTIESGNIVVSQPLP